MRPISAFVITRNEEAKIAECLASLAWVDEIVVVDDFSTDATPEICASFGVRFHQHRFAGFREQKSHAMSLTKNDWVLEIDADERVSSGMKAAILALTDDDFADCSCFSFRRKTRFWGKWITHAALYPDYKGRLYNKTLGVWAGGSVHEKFVTRGACRRLAAEILHPQDLDLATYLQRTIRYARLSAGDLHANGRRASWLHVVVRPGYTFLYRFLVRRGFLDGMHGFAISVVGAIGTFAKYMMLHELQDQDGGDR